VQVGHSGGGLVYGHGAGAAYSTLATGAETGGNAAPREDEKRKERGGRD
jgi:glycine/D-amino acid oxidase-like deaminating enzyme